MLLRLSIT